MELKTSIVGSPNSVITSRFDDNEQAIIRAAKLPVSTALRMVKKRMAQPDTITVTRNGKQVEKTVMVKPDLFPIIGQCLTGL